MFRSLYLIFNSMMLSSTLSACPSIFEKWPIECEIHDRYQSVKNSFATEFHLDIGFLNEYRTLRLISRSMINAVEDDVSQKPWEYYPDSPSWQFWERGAEQMETFAKRLTAPGQKLHLKHLQKMHRKLIDKKKLLMGKSRFMPGAKPGRLRAYFDILPSGILFTRDQPDGLLSEEQFEYLKNYDIRDHQDRPVVRLRPGMKVKEGQITALLFLEGRHVEKTVKLKIQEFNKMCLDLKDGNTDDDISPIQLASNFQKTLISIHPFHEGNGRLTRLVQDLILRSFDLPYAPSGDLTDDLLDSLEVYAEKTRSKLLASVASLENCLQSHRRSLFTNEPINPMCRTIYYKDSSESDNQHRQQRIMRIKVLKLLPKDKDHPLGLLPNNSANTRPHNWTQRVTKKWMSHLSFLAYHDKKQMKK